MFQESNQFGSLARRLGMVFWTATVMLLIGWPAARAQDAGVIQALDLDAPWQVVSGQRGSVERWGVDVPSAGVFVTEIATDNDAQGQLMIELEPGDHGAGQVEAAVLDRTRSRLVVAVAAPGRLVLRASMVDQRMSLANYRLFKRFLSLDAVTRRVDAGWPGAMEDHPRHTRLVDAEDRAVAEWLIWGGPLPTGKTEMEEIDPNPAGAKRVSRTRVVAAWLAPGEQGGNQSFAKTEMEEIDPNPAGQTVPAVRLPGRSDGRWNQALTKTEMEEIDPNPAGLRLDDATRVRVWVTLESEVVEGDFFKTEMEEIDPNPAGLTTPHRARALEFPLELMNPWASRETMADGLLGRLIAAVDQRMSEAYVPDVPAGLLATLGACTPAVGDDHHAALGCATGVRIGDSWVGSLIPHGAEDADAFGFTVPAMSRVAIRVESDEVVSAALYDRSGRRLSPRAVEGTDLRMIEALEPGRYVVRFETRAVVPAHYRFSVRTLDT